MRAPFSCFEEIKNILNHESDVVWDMSNHLGFLEANYYIIQNTFLIHMFSLPMVMDME